MSTSTTRYLGKNWLWLAVNLTAATPLIQILWGYATDSLGVDPVGDLTARTGTAAIVTLVASLACTPLNTVFGFRHALTVRKSLGLWAFAYTTMHLAVFVGLDYGLDLNFILQDALLEKRYIFIGLLALFIMLPLAITSTRGWMRRLGKNWKRLHRLVYVAAALGVTHFFILSKIDKSEPLIFAAVLTLLLALRLSPVRRRASALRLRLFGKQKPAKRASVQRSIPTVHERTSDARTTASGVSSTGIVASKAS